MRELLMRMRAVLRRAAPPPAQEQTLRVGNLLLDRSRHEVRQAEQTVELTPLEFQILEILMQAPGEVIRRADLAMRLMENGYTGSEVVTLLDAVKKW
jgi:DNA-binding response OmpR family regulator